MLCDASAHALVQIMLFADEGKADPFPCSHEMGPRKGKTCLLQLKLIIQFQLRISAPDY